MVMDIVRNYYLFSTYLLNVVTLLKVASSDEKLSGQKVLLLDDTSSLSINIHVQLELTIPFDTLYNDLNYLCKITLTV